MCWELLGTMAEGGGRRALRRAQVSRAGLQSQQSVGLAEGEVPSLPSIPTLTVPFPGKVMRATEHGAHLQGREGKLATPPSSGA